MLLWSTVSLLYVCGELQIKGNAASLRGFQIVGLTDTKLTLFFFLTTLYYTGRWLWTRHLRLRTFKDDGFMSLLRQYGMTKNQVKTETSHAYDVLKGHKEVRGLDPWGDGRFTVLVEENRGNRGAIDELFDLNFAARATSFVEHFMIPFYAPLAIAGLALFFLLARLSRCG